MTESAMPAPAAVSRGSDFRRLGYLLLFGSGFAGLGYELAWARMLSAGLGHEISAVLAVLAAFFVGLGLGGVALGPAIRRSPRPWLWYVVLELVIGLWALLLIVLVPWFNSTVPTLLGTSIGPLAHGVWAFLAVLLLLLPATAAMGATLPALERTVALTGSRDRIAGLYAANTLGACAGVLLVTFVIAPALGFRTTLILCAGINALCAAIAYARWSGERLQAATEPHHAAPGSTGLSRQRLLATLFVCGFVGIGYEVLTVRLLSQVLEDTVYTFAAVLSVYLLGTALGAAWQQRQPAAENPRLRLTHYLNASALTLAFGAATLWFAGTAFNHLQPLLGPGLLSGVSTDLLLAAAALGAPALAMGALFSHLTRTATAQINLGTAIGINTLGGALAPLLCGVVLLPAVGAKWALISAAGAYLLLLPSLRPASAAALAGVLALCAAPSLRHVDLPEGASILDYDDGVLSSIAVVEDTGQVRHLKVNNHFTMGSTSSGFADHRQTHLPLLLHPAPRSALFLGVGTGMSLNAAQYHSDLTVTAVELLPEALDRLHWFGTAPDQNAWPLPPTLVASDARRFVLSNSARYDVIIADLFHPSRDGAGSLFTAEHFQAIGARLAPDGLFMQWLPLFQMDLDTLRTITATFADAFPEVGIYLPHFSLQQPVVGLLGARVLPQYNDGYLLERVQHRPLQRALVQTRLNADAELLGGYLGGRDAALAFAGAAQRNTDNLPVVTYQAPLFAYERRGGHGERVNALVNALAQHRRAGGLTPDDSPFAQRMTRYWAARDRYLQIGLDVRADMTADEMRARTTGPLLDVVGLSADFQPAYAPLLNQAWSLRGSDPEAARALLEQLLARAPQRPEAREALQALDAATRRRP